jgi:dTMP kinase
MFFSFDGIDGVGKTTQMRLFCEWLQASGHNFVTCRDPGSTALGERVREILLQSDHTTPISPRSEMLLYMAARAQLVEEVIRPALAADNMVVSDRFLLANIVYQGYAGGVDIAEIRAVGQVATGGIMPDCVFLLDMPPHQARLRMGSELDRIEQRGGDYRKRLREGFLAEAAVMGSSVHVIDAHRPIEEIQLELREIAGRVIS